MTSGQREASMCLDTPKERIREECESRVRRKEEEKLGMPVGLDGGFIVGQNLNFFVPDLFLLGR